MTIKEWCAEIHAYAKSKGFWDTARGFPEQIALMHSELSEALEEYRNNKADIYFENGKPEGLAIELADTVIRIMDTCNAYGFDLEKAIEVKMEYNRNRPHMHGGKKC